MGFGDKKYKHPNTVFRVGDYVIDNRRPDDRARGHGYITGFPPSGPGSKWVVVKTLDGRRCIWRKDRVSNLDDAPGRQPPYQAPDFRDVDRAWCGAG